ncbi:aromatic amino acid aminotransferase [Salipaludibacillus neizhouensis]|uniref:Aminotransferase n=1 Tax=Salipaludibacillus neizhouensis TaxID=885475 RepID=A0A3A9KJB7_9BACI|nr:aminotransferase [Salipaludibacillus neizhouensis]RKL64986.1 aromatic amino acid aminotransferase [Salipaludibacillus neizhouensis]
MSTMKTDHKTQLSEAVNSIKPSGIRRFFDLASKMDNIISLGVGEPDYSTPWNVREASIHSLERGLTSYTANAGMIELREAIAQYLERRFDVSYNPEDEIVVTVGASEGIDLALRAIVNPGDEILIVEPCFVSYAPLVSLVGGVPVSVPTSLDTNFEVTSKMIEERITDKTKAVMLSFPSNPTGSIMGEEALASIARVVCEHDLVVLSDEIYAELTYDTEHVSVPSIKGMRDRTILISGFSKAFAMTGWRVGYVTAPSTYAKAMLKIHQYSMMCASTMAQYAALEALTNGRDEMEEMITSYRQRRNYVVKSFREIGLTCHNPGGAFYVFPSIIKTGFTSEQFAEKLLVEERVAVVPGDVFGQGGEGHIRCSYAASMNQLEEAVERIDRFINKRVK